MLDEHRMLQINAADKYLKQRYLSIWSISRLTRRDVKRLKWLNSLYK